MIDLGLGQPDASVFPAEMLGRAAAACYSGLGASDDFLQYGAEYGDGHHRVALAHFLTDAYQIPIDPELLFSTNGNSQALDLVCTVFTRPGHVVIAEEPTYFLASGIFADHGLEVVGVPLDDEGVQIDLIEMALADLDRAGRPARLIYTIPAFQNPTGITLSAKRRLALSAIAARYQTLVVADEVYQLLDYGSGTPSPMSSLVEQGNVISLGTFSKILAPGLRLGWIHSTPEILRRLAGSGVVASGGGLNPMTSALVTEVIRSGDLDAHIKALRSEYARRVGVMDDALRTHMPTGVSWRCPTGGYFFWLALPDGLDGAELRTRATQAGVDFRPGTLFSSAGALHGFIRLSFAYYVDRDIVEGIARLGEALRA